MVDPRLLRTRDFAGSAAAMVGYAAAAQRRLGSEHRGEAATALRQAFAGGSGVTAWAASAIGMTSCCLRLMLLRGGPEPAAGVFHVAPGERPHPGRGSLRS